MPYLKYLYCSFFDIYTYLHEVHKCDYIIHLVLYSTDRQYPRIDSVATTKCAKVWSALSTFPALQLMDLSFATLLEFSLTSANELLIVSHWSTKLESYQSTLSTKWTNSLITLCIFIFAQQSFAWPWCHHLTIPTKYCTIPPECLNQHFVQAI